MISGSGSLSAGFPSLTSLLTGNTGRGLFGLPARSNSPDVNNTGESNDTVQLTDAGRNALQTIQEKLTDLQQQEAEFSIAQLNELKERIKLTGNLLRNAGPEQAGLIYNQLDEIAGSLAGIGNRIGFVLSESQQTSSNIPAEKQVDLQNLIDEFRGAVRQLASLLGVAHNFFDQKPVIPQPLLDAIRQLLGPQGGERSEPLVINQET